MRFEQEFSKVIVTNFQEFKLSLPHRKNNKFSNLGVTFIPKLPQITRKDRSNVGGFYMEELFCGRLELLKYKRCLLFVIRNTLGFMLILI